VLVMRKRVKNSTEKMLMRVLVIKVRIQLQGQAMENKMIKNQMVIMKKEQIMLREKLLTEKVMMERETMLEVMARM